MMNAWLGMSSGQTRREGTFFSLVLKTSHDRGSDCQEGEAFVSRTGSHLGIMNTMGMVTAPSVRTHCWALG